MPFPIGGFLEPSLYL